MHTSPVVQWIIFSIFVIECIINFIAMGSGRKEQPSIESLPDKVLLRVFSFLKHSEMMKYSVVSKKWRMMAQDSRLWAMVSLRPEISGLMIPNIDMLLKLIQVKILLHSSVDVYILDDELCSDRADEVHDQPEVPGASL